MHSESTGTICSPNPELSSDHISLVHTSDWMGTGHSRKPGDTGEHIPFLLFLLKVPQPNRGTSLRSPHANIHSLKASSCKGPCQSRPLFQIRAPPRPRPGPRLTPCPSPTENTIAQPSPAQPGGSGPSIVFPGVQTNFSCFPEPVSLAEPGGAFNRINPSLAAVTKTDFSTKRSICISRALSWFFSVRMFKIS